MVRIPQNIKEFVEQQGIFAVGSVGGTKIPNVSPRIFFHIEDDAIYWLDFFKHKSYRNFNANPWVTVSVFDKDTLRGYQFRGIVSFITDEPTKSELKRTIVAKTLQRHDSEKTQKIAKRDAEVIQFEIKVCYSLNPEEYTDMCIGSDIDSTQLFKE